MRKKKIKPNSEVYMSELRKDPYLNCLKAKYGYAVTCHKAQGGEWDYVYLFLDKKMYGMKKPELFRWWYTAITRTRKQLHLTNEWWIA
jgi:superfamily I DNA/RNA helicase